MVDLDALAVALPPAEVAARFADVLRRAGIPVGPDRAGRFAAALRLLPPDTRDRLYWTARVTLLADPAQEVAFDAAFGAVFDGALDSVAFRGDPFVAPIPSMEDRRSPARADRPTVEETRPPWDDPRAGRADDQDAPWGRHEAERHDVPSAASTEERLRETPFAEVDPAEVLALRDLVRRIALATPTRLTRRSRATHRAGERVDLRRTLRATHRTGGDAARLVHRRRRRRPRRLVLLCDVSGSMEPYARVFLTLLHGAVADVHAEAFVFATRLTRLTGPLSGRDVDAALARAAAAAPDWAGGTRLGESLRSFVDVWGRRGAARGAVVVVLSDGWDRGDPARVGEQMARLRRLAHRIVWVNPRKAAADYAPLVGGMAAALPYCDAFVSGHTLAALTDVVTAVAGREAARRKR